MYTGRIISDVRKMIPKLIIIMTTMTSVLSLSCVSKSRLQFDEEQWLQRVKATDIQALYAPNVNKNGRFFNPWMERPKLPYSIPYRSGKKFDKFPEKKYSHVPNDYSYLKDSANSISFLGHATFILKLDGATIFTDPFFSNRAGFPAKEVKIKFNYEKVPQRPIVLISHNHYDHLDKKSVQALSKKNNAIFIVPLKLGSYMKKLGAKEVHELGWWQSIVINGVKYTLLPAQHWSMRAAWGQGNSRSLWGGFLIEGSKTIYFSGDTGYFRGFEEFGNRYKIDYALIGAGAYEPRWFMHYVHTNVDEFFRAADDLKAKFAIPFHFGVISLSEEPLLYPLYEIEQHISKHPEYAERILPLRVGEFIMVE